MFSNFVRDDELRGTLKNYIEHKLQPCEPQAYAYTVMNKKNPLQIMVISSYPDEWVKLYMKNGFQRFDPVILSAIKTISPFSWGENIDFMSDVKAAKIFRLAKSYSITNGFTFVVHDHMDNVALLSLIINKQQRPDVERYILQSTSEIQMKIINIHEYMNKMLWSSQNKRLSMNAGSLLTAQENIVLNWASMGKTYEEIAVIIGITRKTVKFHMENVVRKMGVSNARQAVRLGVELGLITGSCR